MNRQCRRWSALQKRRGSANAAQVGQAATDPDLATPARTFQNRTALWAAHLGMKRMGLVQPGKKGERIVFIRTLITGKGGNEPGRSIDTVANTGQYL